MQTPWGSPFSVVRLGPAPRGGQLRCGLMAWQGVHVEQHFITPQHALVYWLEGQGWYEDDRGQRFTLKPGMVYQRFPNRAHSVGHGEAGWRAYIAVPAQVHELLALTSAWRVTQPVFTIGCDRALIQDLRDIATELKAQPEADLILTLERMIHMIVILLRRGAENDPLARLSAPIQEAMQILEQDLHTPLAIPAVAAAVHLSYSTFRRRFLQEVGTSPGAYRIRRRIEQAITLIQQQPLSFQAVAEQLGYSDVYAFSAQFKKVTGTTPGAFRRQMGLRQ